MIYFHYYLLIPTRIEKECRSCANSEGWFNQTKDTYYSEPKNVLFLILLIVMSKQFHRHKIKFIFSEEFGTIYFSLTCLSPLTDCPANIRLQYLLKH
jgi:hypothetical protein